MSVLPPRKLSLGVPAVAALLALSACGGGDSPSGESPEPGSGGAGDISLAVQAAPNSLDPAQLNDGQQRYIWGSVYDTLLYPGEDGALQPNAAESWEYSEDARTLTLDLRDGMTFSDGDPVTAEAVKTTLERTRTTVGPQQGNLAAVESIDTPDEDTVVLNLSSPDPNLLGSLAQGAGVIGDPDTIDSPDTALDPVGSGAYVLDQDATVAGSSYVLERRDDHWNADAYPFETVTVRVIADRTAAVNALLAGEVDAGGVDAAQAKQAEAAGLGVTVVEGQGVGGLVLADRGGQVAPELADVRVRQAINLALDRQGFVDAILQGLGTPTTQIFNPASQAYVEALDEEYPHDPERARELLAEAGYADGFTLELPANLIVQNFQPSITQALEDVGITVEWQPVTMQTNVQTTDWAGYFNIGSVAPPARTAALYYAPGGSHNPFGYQDPELDALLEEAANTVDPDEAAEIYQEINEFGVDNALFAPIFALSQGWALAPGVTFEGTANSPQDIRSFGAE
ncbi:ABC transporter substrate-binding protein [Modestobacter sp. VKM Ac-2984]|uniref:ABC transporter substrate-binding protein n=1 Tax=Modestobacter sp. VKM Ac-2984 TaxID=3004138 RepID=UPI0022AAFEA0|nr:ABC transporter substrate-binding protein [Modestobacter sp. VKM Ac-2984]MCZ2816349.1 ABC transporter substrate-binding protein [Modestobacter sp. VKM Ac-2984]